MRYEFTTIPDEEVPRPVDQLFGHLVTRRRACGGPSLITWASIVRRSSCGSAWSGWGGQVRFERG
jgi:hypothetical protein